MNDDSRLDCSDIPRSCCGQTEEYCTCTPKIKESQTTDTQKLKAEICHCVDETPQYAIKKLIEMGHPFCSRCGGKLSAV